MIKKDKKIDKKKKIHNIKKKYFYKNPNLSTEQIQNLLTLTKDYVSSVNLKYDSKFKHSILQSTISLVIHNNEVQEKEQNEK